MLLLVPTSPEVPKALRPKSWPSIVLALSLVLGFALSLPVIRRDAGEISRLSRWIERTPAGGVRLAQQGHDALKRRELLQIAPAKADWSLRRLLIANFIHGNVLHLILNVLGIFIGARLVSVFLRLPGVILAFLLCGGAGLFSSLFLSSEISPYVPHVGASGGVFGLMGVYYVFNFRYRTIYFFWFPSRKNGFMLPTSWFFFVDVLLLELFLSIGQFFPTRLDSVDHVAHVVGFMTGVLFALAIRTILRWPSYVHTWKEYRFWSALKRPRKPDITLTPLSVWLDLLRINMYNDQVKHRLFHLVAKRALEISQFQLGYSLSLLSPTYVRLYPANAGVLFRRLIKLGVPIPENWLTQLPYDSFIRIARELAEPAEESYVLHQFLELYQKNMQGNSAKLELLIERIRDQSVKPPGSPFRRAS